MPRLMVKKQVINFTKYINLIDMIWFKKEKLDRPSVDWTKPKEALTAIKRFIIATAESEQNWYSKTRAINGATTRLLRFIACQTWKRKSFGFL